MDTFHSHTSNLESPARCATNVTPNDVVSLGHVTRALYVGTGGDLAVVMADGANVTFRGVPAGMILPIRVSKVLANGTTADALIGLW